jgi:hypothetical protein
MSYKKWRDPWRLHAKDLSKGDDWEWIEWPKINWKMIAVGLLFIILSFMGVSDSAPLKSPYEFPYNENTELHILKGTRHDVYICATSRECYELYLELQYKDRSIQCDTKMYIKRTNGYVWRLANER